LNGLAVGDGAIGIAVWTIHSPEYTINRPGNASYVEVLQQ
jgi:hypothetical protein